MMDLRSNRSRSRTPFLQTRLDQEIVTTEQQQNHSSEEISVQQHTYSTRNRSFKLNSSAMSDEVFSSPVVQKSGRITRRNRHKTSDYSSEDGENEISSSKTDHSDLNRSRTDTYRVRSNGETKSALQVYKEAGEYWNKYPKTDYTYSIHSKDRIEVAPGVIAMPNMSRRSLRQSTETNISATTSANTITAAAATSANINNNTSQHQYYNESDADYYSADTTLHYNQQPYQPKALFRGGSDSSYFEQTTTSTTAAAAAVAREVVGKVSIVTRLYRSVRAVLWQILARVLTAVTVLYWTCMNAVLWLGRGYYRAVSRVLLFDTWLLQSGAGGKKKYGVLAALVAVPLLILGGWWFWSSVSGLVHGAFISTHTPIAAAPISRTDTTARRRLGEQLAKLIIPTADTTTRTDTRQQLDIEDIVRRLLEHPEFENIIRAHVSAHATILDAHQQHEVQHVKDDLTRVSMKVDTLAASIRADNARTELKLAAQLNRCCRRQFIHIETYVRKIIGDLLGGCRSDGQATEEDISTWLHTLFVAKNELETRLANVTQHLSGHYERLIALSAVQIMDDVAERINVKLREKLELNRNSIGVTSALTDSQVERIVKDTLAIYDADKTGLVDYALEPSGGQVLSTRCTESYNSRTAVLSVLGIPLWYPSNTPRVVISPGVTPGECWAFQNFPGFLVIQLTARVQVQGFTLEHIPQSLAPGGRRDSAPRQFTVWGLATENDREPELLGEYEYDLAGPSLQFFAATTEAAEVMVQPVEREERMFNMVELRVESNHGNMNYTCLYRFRVHGVYVGDVEPT